MQTDHRVPSVNTTAMRQQHRKRSYSNGSFRRRDRNDLICVVCHAPAMGYNFDQITCESCKAFFRRNALHNAGRLKCRAGTNDCIITLETRKRCKSCRLKKCFDKGLRKEWIMSEEEKHLKKQKIEDNRRLRVNSILLPSRSLTSIVPTQKFVHFSLDQHDNEWTTDTSIYTHSLEDHLRSALVNIEKHYTQAVRFNMSVVRGYDNSCLRRLNEVVDVVNEPAYISSLRLITFFKLTPEFNLLHEDDRLTLVKHNLLTMLYLHFFMCTNVQTGIFQELNMTGDYCYSASGLRAYSDSVYHKGMELTAELQDLTSNDHLVMKLIILIVLFSKGADHLEPVLLESNKVFRSQNIFVNLLWNYLNVRFGEDLTVSLFSRLMCSCLKTHALARETKKSVAEKNVPNEELAPLMQSVMQISQ